MLGFNGLNKGAFTRHLTKSPVFLKSIRHREPNISQIWCTRRLSKNPAPYNNTFLCFSFLFSEEKFNKIDDEFTKCNTFLVSCLGNIVKRGAFPHCKSFLWRVKNFSSTNLSPSSVDMLESLALQRSFEPLFTEGMFLSRLCLLFGLKKGARRWASNVPTLAFVVSTLFVVLAFQWKTHENAKALFKMGVRGRGWGESFFFAMTSHFVQYRICLSRKAEKLESYPRFAKISNQQTFSFYTSIYTWKLAAENDSLAWKKTRENINAL